MLPPILALDTTNTDGIVTVIGVAAAGSVPATAQKLGGMAVSQTGGLYVVWNAS
jgi:hypothetical protein